jgi:hypothetical protein
MQLYTTIEAQNMLHIVRTTHVMVMDEALFKTDPPDVLVVGVFVEELNSGSSTFSLYAL